MKKILLTILPLVAVLFLGACSDSKDDVAKKYSLTVNVTLPDAYSWSDITEGTVTAKNSLTGQEFAANKMSDGVYVAEVVGGEYQVAVSMVASDAKMLNGSKAASVYAAATVEVKAEVAITSALVIKEFYTAMCKTPANKNYMYDQFYEIYNNSAFTVYLDNCFLARTEVAANAKTIFWGNNDEVNQEVALSSYVAAFVSDPAKPGKTYPLAAGESIVIAFQAQDHVNIGTEPNPNTVDLSKADYEIDITDYKSTYVANPDVPNMTIVAKPGTQTLNFGLAPAFGCGLVLAKVADIEKYVEDQANWRTKPEGTDTQPYLVAKYKDIQDAINIVSEAETNRRVVLPAQVDAGIVYTSAMYNGMGFTRKVESVVGGRTIYKDTNNSSEDFEAEAKPTPGV